MNAKLFERVGYTWFLRCAGLWPKCQRGSSSVGCARSARSFMSCCMRCRASRDGFSGNTITETWNFLGQCIHRVCSMLHWNSKKKNLVTYIFEIHHSFFQVPHKLSMVSLPCQQPRAASAQTSALTRQLPAVPSCLAAVLLHLVLTGRLLMFAMSSCKL